MGMYASDTPLQKYKLCIHAHNHKPQSLGNPTATRTRTFLSLGWQERCRHVLFMVLVDLKAIPLSSLKALNTLPLLTLSEWRAAAGTSLTKASGQRGLG